jgi:hypothetical protein
MPKCVTVTPLEFCALVVIWHTFELVIWNPPPLAAPTAEKAVAAIPTRVALPFIEAVTSLFVPAVPGSAVCRDTYTFANAVGNVEFL